MLTLRQIEAFVRIVEFGTFERAALRLATTQSAISKRVRELELSLGVRVFDRAQRGARLTPQGEEVLDLARQILALQSRMLGLREADQPARRIRIGVTELTAITWLPRLVAALRAAWPAAVVEPEIETGRTLQARLVEGAIDLAVIPQAMPEADTVAVRLGRVAHVWMARPGLTPRGRMTLRELADHPILAQAGRSGAGVFFGRWLEAQGVTFQRRLETDNLMAVVGLAVAGLGVAYLPRDCFQPLIAEGKLCRVPVTPELPPLPYAAVWRRDQPSGFVAEVAGLMREVCDFSRQMQS